MFVPRLSLSCEMMLRLPGPSSVFKHCIKMQERFRKHDTCYPSTSNLTLLDFQMYCKMQRCVAVVKKEKKNYSTLYFNDKANIMRTQPN